MNALVLAADGVNVAQNVGFGLIAAVMIFAALSVVMTKNVVHAALWLVLVLGGVAAQYILAAAEFVAVSQVMVYIGAVMVLFLFGIMLTRAQIGAEDGLNNKGWQIGIPVAVVLFGLLAFVILDATTGDDVAETFSNVDKDGLILDERSDTLASTLVGPLSDAVAAEPNNTREAVNAVLLEQVGPDRAEVSQAILAAVEAVAADDELEVNEATLLEPVSGAISQTGQTLTTQAISDRVLFQYLAPFFGMTFVLLAAAIGSIVLARKD